MIEADRRGRLGNVMPFNTGTSDNVSSPHSTDSKRGIVGGAIKESNNEGEDIVLAMLRNRGEEKNVAAQEMYARAQTKYRAARHRARKVEACLAVLQSELNTLEASVTHHDTYVIFLEDSYCIKFCTTFNFCTGCIHA